MACFFEEKPVSASSSDIETEPDGKRNGTATPQNGAISDGKVSDNPPISQGNGEKVEENQDYRVNKQVQY